MHFWDFQTTLHSISQVKTVPWVVGPLRKASANVIYALLGGLDIRCGGTVAW